MKLSPKEILKPALALLIICVAATALLALTNSVTAARIAETERENAIAARRTVMPDAADFGEEQTYDTLTYCNALDADGNTVGRVFTAAAKGYGGTVSVMIGIDADGKITGIEILSHSETPGLGANSTKPAFKNRFAGKSGTLTVSKTSNDGENVQAITAATITSKAVTSAVNAALAADPAIEGGAS